MNEIIPLNETGSELVLCILHRVCVEFLEQMFHFEDYDVSHYAFSYS
jgi:hypothetical protein